MQVIVNDGDQRVGLAGAPQESSRSCRSRKAHLWSPDDPHLYNLQVSSGSTGTTIDQVGSYFGMRKISLGKDDQGRTRILLNNEFLFERGVLDQGYWPDGIYTAPTDEALR